MQHYLNQLLTDITEASQNLSLPFVVKESYAIQDMLAKFEEEANAPVRHLAEWTGIAHEMLPPSNLLSDDELNLLLLSLKDLLEKCNCHFVLQTQVPERFQYEAIRLNWNQEIKLLEWNMGFFSMCKLGTPPKTCALGEYCQCLFYEELLRDKVDENLTLEEERALDLEFEIQYLTRKHGSDWMKYYPYHLDKNYDDENGNPYNYGMNDNDEDDNDDW